MRPEEVEKTWKEMGELALEILGSQLPLHVPAAEPSPECPPLQWFLAKGRGREWTDGERQHMWGCAYCQRMLRVGRKVEQEGTLAPSSESFAAASDCQVLPLSGNRLARPMQVGRGWYKAAASLVILLLIATTAYALYERKHANSAYTALELESKKGEVWYRLGVMLAEKNNLAAAVAAYQEALELDPENARTWNNLGVVRRHQADYVRAVEAFGKAVALDPKYANAQANLAKSQKRLALDKKLDDVLKGGEATSEDLLALADNCSIRTHFFAATQLYARAFEKDPKLADDLTKRYRFKAVIAATLAARGKSKDGENKNLEDRTRVRAQALNWLKADLVTHAKLIKTNPAWLHDDMKDWRQRADLASLRDEEEFAKLTADERDAAKKIWAEVNRLATEASSRYVLIEEHDDEVSRENRQRTYWRKMTGGRTYVIVMNNAQFFTDLTLKDAQGKVAADDGYYEWPDRTSRIVFTAPADGVYGIVATSLQGRGAGAYTLTIREFTAQDR